jgi:DNA-binding GntR family transcriptional regulator
MVESYCPNLISLSDEVANTIKERILKGEYSIGEKLKENQIAYELKVSRTPIREALKQLEKEGLVESIPNRGSFVLGLTKQDIQDIYAVRAAVEVLAADWAVSRITGEELKQLREVFDLMEFYSDKQNSDKVLELNKEFHQIIYHASGSRFLSQLLKSYQEYVEETRKATVYCSENLPLILEEHRNILEAVCMRNGQLAKERLSIHLANSQKRAELSMKI